MILRSYVPSLGTLIEKAPLVLVTALATIFWPFITAAVAWITASSVSCSITVPLTVPWANATIVVIDTTSKLNSLLIFMFMNFCLFDVIFYGKFNGFEKNKGISYNYLTFYNRFQKI